MSYDTRFVLPALALTAALSLFSCGKDDPKANAGHAVQQQAAMANVTVTIAQGAMGKGPAAFGQNPLTIAAGTMVTWTNADSLPHTATSTSGVWDSGTMQPGQSFTRTFNDAGTFPYFCAIHGAASMSGTIVVTPGPSPSPSPSTSPTPSPSPSVSPSPTPTSTFTATPKK
jgi:plastocyanin